MSHIAFDRLPVYVILSLDDRSVWYTYTDMKLHSYSYSDCFRSYGQCYNVHPVACILCLHWRHCSGLSSVCVLA